MWMIDFMTPLKLLCLRVQLHHLGLTCLTIPKKHIYLHLKINLLFKMLLNTQKGSIACTYPDLSNSIEFTQANLRQY